MTARARTLCTLILGVALALVAEEVRRQLWSVGADEAARADRFGGPASLSSELAPLNPLNPPPVTRFAALVERPPFSQSRRPPVSAPVPVDEPPPATPTAPPPFTSKLLGVRIQPDNRAALFHGSGQRSARWVSEGEIVDGWTVYGIDQSGVFLRFADQPYELRLWPQ